MSLGLPDNGKSCASVQSLIPLTFLVASVGFINAGVEFVTTLPGTIASRTGVLFRGTAGGRYRGGGKQFASHLASASAPVKSSNRGRI
ncbi:MULTISPECIES: hypothetical protein [Bradyrhizobium]|nr:MULTISPECIES: hypothetical protein [Bradyrhizobium]